MRVDTVSVQRIHGQSHAISWDGTDQVAFTTQEQPVKFKLALMVNIDLKVMHVQVVNVLEQEVRVRGIDPTNA